MSVTPFSTVVGIFRDRAMAEQAIEALYDAGFHREQIRYSMPDSAGGFFADLKNMFMGTTPNDTNGDHLADDLTGIGLSDEESQYYADEYANGNTILTVQAADREQEALSILHQHGAYNSRVSPGSFRQANDDGQQPSHDDRPDKHATSEQENDIEDWETQRLPRTVEEHPVNDKQHDGVAAEPAVQPAVVTPEHPMDYRGSQTNGAVSGQGDEMQRLQEQIRALQQQLEDARNQLQGAKEHETHLQTMREREQQLQSSRQQVQDLQAELEATLAELRETQQRIGQYQSVNG